MKKNYSKFKDYEDDDHVVRSKKKIREEQQRRNQRNLKNNLRSKSFDVTRFQDDDE